MGVGVSAKGGVDARGPGVLTKTSMCGTVSRGPLGPGCGGGGVEFSPVWRTFLWDDVDPTVEQLTAQGVEFDRDVSDEGFGLLKAIRRPGAGRSGSSSRAPNPVITPA